MAGGDRKSADAALIAALVTGATRQEAAKAAGVGESTVYRRLADPAFRRRVSAARSELIDAAVGRLADATTEACQTLRRGASSSSPTSTTSRLSWPSASRHWKSGSGSRRGDDG